MNEISVLIIGAQSPRLLPHYRKILESHDPDFWTVLLLTLQTVGRQDSMTHDDDFGLASSGYLTPGRGSTG
ncbi:hypothetical protein [Spirulina major]|uniref:hypothetical protein n=1 Tax=Spirulina major TaxID=270636 RepID=UPI0009351504|nr:hypothetical protein [Spirulina major]